MIEELVEIDKKTLHEHYNRVLRSEPQFKYLQLKFLWDFIHNSDSFKPLCDAIKSTKDERDMRAFRIVDNNERLVLPEDHTQRVYLFYSVIEKILSPNHQISVMNQIGFNYSQNGNGTTTSYFNLFNDLFLEPFVFYLINQTNRKVVILDLLSKYKHRSEWFNRHMLYSTALDQTNKAESNLKTDLYKYLFDSGLSLTIEPTSPSGEIDFIGAQKNSSNKLFAEVKIYDSKNRNKKYVENGIWQLLTYMKDFNISDGYLIVYNVCPTTISFDFKNKLGEATHCIIENKRIFFVVVDINIHEKSANKRGKPTVETIDHSCLN